MPGRESLSRLRECVKDIFTGHSNSLHGTRIEQTKFISTALDLERSKFCILDVMPIETMKKTPAELSILAMAKQSGLREHTLRYYERIGLLSPIPRDGSSGHRRYSPETVSVVESLACLRGTGMSIDDIRKYLRLRERGTAAAGEQKALFEAHRAALACEMERMQYRLKYLAGKVAYFAAVEAGDEDKAGKIGEANRLLAKAMAQQKEHL